MAGGVSPGSKTVLDGSLNGIPGSLGGGGGRVGVGGVGRLIATGVPRSGRLLIGVTGGPSTTFGVALTGWKGGRLGYWRCWFR
ncbi:MAG: hypothetical protein WD544_00360, partial [Patescibacteria group bacterium]